MQGIVVSVVLKHQHQLHPPKSVADAAGAIVPKCQSESAADVPPTAETTAVAKMRRKGEKFAESRWNFTPSCFFMKINFKLILKKCAESRWNFATGCFLICILELDFV